MHISHQWPLSMRRWLDLLSVGIPLWRPHTRKSKKR